MGQILSFLERLFATLGPSPHGTLTGRQPPSPSLVSDLSHRFISPRGVYRFLLCIRKVLLRHGSLEGLYRQSMERRSVHPREWLGGFLAGFREAWGTGIPRERDFLFPDPRKGSACKRHNLFLRWVVREEDGVDLGIWTVLSPAELIVPVDTHMARLGRYLGITERNAVDGRMAEEITGAFRAVCPEDPVRFDFALTRIGILKDCTATSRGTCKTCPLAPSCSGRALPLLPRPGGGRRRPFPGENDVAPPSPLG